MTGLSSWAPQRSDNAAMTESSGRTASPYSRTQRAWHDGLELLSSMRFAITLLCVICIASVIGTVVQQNEPLNNYINQFGPFWADVFARFRLFNVYSAGWFLLILAFLVLSTSLCIARNAPKFLADIRTFKEDIRAQSLKAFHHKAQGELNVTPEAALTRMSQILARHGWKAKAQMREDGTMVAARKGRINKVGYIAAHAAIVLICLGGLSDGDLIVRAQMWLQGKTAFDGGGFIRDVGPEHRLSESNPTFRGNLFVPEGGRSGTAVLNMPDGIVVQDLPFDVELKKFIVEYYDTGMPKLFASQIVIHDRDTGASEAATVKVNEPVFHRGVAIYQSSFDDGGSKLALSALPLRGAGKPLSIEGRIGDSIPMANGPEKYTLELSGLKVINVENLGDTSSATDVRAVDLSSTLEKHLGAGIDPDKKKTFHNVGPAFTYKLRDASGQAREFNNYMLPMDLDGQKVYVVGVRDSTDDNFHYLRIPVDDQNGMNVWLHVKQALADSALRAQAAARYAKLATPDDKPEMAEQLRITGERALALFSGSERAVREGDAAPGGLVALSQFVDSTVPQADRQRVAGVLLRILNGSLFELTQMVRERDGLPTLANDAAAQAYMTQAVLSLSDSYFYPAPFLLQLTGFQQVQASVFQVARAPGKKLVYLGAVLLILGVFAMLYIRERRLWIWLTPHEGGTTGLMIALSTPRRTLDTDAEFDAMRHELLDTSVVVSGEKS